MVRKDVKNLLSSSSSEEVLDQFGGEEALEDFVDQLLKNMDLTNNETNFEEIYFMYFSHLFQNKDLTEIQKQLGITNKA